MKMPAPYPRNQVTALILAGGMGQRVGGQDKGLLMHEGKPLVVHLAEVLSGQAARLLVSANRSHTEYRALGFTPLPDLRPDYPGPLAGIEAGFAASTTDFLLVCPCDTPAIPADMGPRLWDAMQAANADLAYACDGQRDHYLHALLPAGLAADLSTFLDSGQRAVRYWLADKRAARASFSAAEMLNINEKPQLD